MAIARINQGDTIVLRGNGVVCGTNLFNTTLGSIIVAVCTSRPGDASGDPPTMAMVSAGTWNAGPTQATTNHRQQIFWKINESADAIASVEFQATSGAKDSFDMSIHVMEFSHDFTTPTLLASSSATSGGTSVNGLESGAVVATSGALAVSSGTIRRSDTSLTCGIYGNQNGTDWDTNESAVMSLDRFTSRASWIEGTGASENVEWGAPPGSTASMVALIAVIGEGASGNTYTENRTVSATVSVTGSDAFTGSDSRTVSITSTQSSTSVATSSESGSVLVAVSVSSTASLTGTESRQVSIVASAIGSDSTSRSESTEVTAAVSITGSDLLTATESRSIAVAVGVSGASTVTGTEAENVSIVVSLDSTATLLITEARFVTAALTLSGSDDLTLGSATTQQLAFRWRNDDGSETTATWRAAQNSNTSVDKNTTVRLRFLIDASGDLPASQFKLQYRKVGDPDWLDIG